MNLFDLFVRIGVKDEASDKLSKITSGIGSGLKAAASVGIAAVSVAASGIAALTTAAVKNYTEYEQLVGGAELMFGEAFNSVMQNSQNAYKTVQMSQNEYLKQVNGFATGLKTALGGNEQAAADLANKIIQAEADIVAATGVTQDSVQNAFNGIMKSNFTMLDNLQIGITPTKEGFQEVIDKVNEWNAANGNATKYQMGNLADMQSALVDYIGMIGMSGYAQQEALKTIEGSAAAVKATWRNLVTGVADDTADFGMLVGNFVDSVGVAAENVLPRVATALNGAARLITALLPQIFEALPVLVGNVLPQMAEAAIEIVQAFVVGISDNADLLINSAFDIINILVNGFVELLPMLTEVALQLIVALANGFSQNAPTLIPQIVDCVLLIVDTLIAHAPELLIAGAELISQLLVGLVNSAPSLVEWASNLPISLLDVIIQNGPQLVAAGENLVNNIMQGFVVAWNGFVLVVKNLINELLSMLHSAITSIPGAEAVLNKLGFDGPLQISTTFEEDKMRDAKRAMGAYAPSPTININTVQQTPGQIANAVMAGMSVARW